MIWRPLGYISICSRGWPLFPVAPRAAGLYRLTLNDGRSYIGQAKNLRDQFYDYRRPPQGNEDKHYLHYAIVAAGGGSVDIFTDSALSSRALRDKIAYAAIQVARQEGARLLNREGQWDPDRLRWKIQFLEAQLAAARADLAAMSEIKMAS